MNYKSKMLLCELKWKLKHSQRLGWKKFWSEAEMIYWLSELEYSLNNAYTFSIEDNKLKAKVKV